MTTSDAHPDPSSRRADAGRVSGTPSSGHPSTAVFARRLSRESILGAATAVGALIVVKFAYALFHLLGNAVGYDPTSYASGFLASPIGLFLGEVVLYPFSFYVAAFVGLAVFFPIVQASPLSTVLKRAVAAGTLGTVVLAAVGIATGILMSLSSGDWIFVVLYVLFIPLSAGILMTAVLVAGSTLAWLWLGRESGVSDSSGASPASGESRGEPSDAAVAAGASDAHRTEAAEDAGSDVARNRAAASPASAAPTSSPPEIPLSVFAPPTEQPLLGAEPSSVEERPVARGEAPADEAESESESESDERTDDEPVAAKTSPARPTDAAPPASPTPPASDNPFAPPAGR